MARYRRTAARTRRSPARRTYSRGAAARSRTASRRRTGTSRGTTSRIVIQMVGAQPATALPVGMAPAAAPRTRRF